MFNKKKRMIEELEKELKDAVKSKDRYYSWLNEAKEKLQKAEAELEASKKEQDYWYGQYQIMSTRSSTYQFMVEKYFFENRDKNIDDEGVIYNGKVYKIVGRKQIVDGLGDTVDLHCELVDPNKDNTKPTIGFKPIPEEKKEDKE